MIDLLRINDPEGEYPKSYYTSTVSIQNVLPSLQENIKCQICIIGAGFTGLSAALSLADLGYESVVLEANRIGFGASGRNGGQVGSGQRWDQEKLEMHFGFKQAQIFWNIAEEAKKEVYSRIKRHEIKCDYNPGVIQACINRRDTLDSYDQVDQLTEKYNYQNLRKLNHEGISEILDTDFYKGGYLDLGAGHLNPLKFVLGLGSAALTVGVKIYEKTKVAKIEYGKKNKLTTSAGAVVNSDYLLVAGNGYLGNLDEQTASRVMPINNFIIATEPLKYGFLESFLHHNYAVADSKFVPNYFRPSPDKRLIFGGGENYTYKFPKNFKETARKKMIKVYPQLKDSNIDFSWGGTLAITRNRLPCFRKVSDTAYSISGYSGHGVALSIIAGKIFAELIAKKSERFDFFSQLPIEPFPGKSSFRWPLMVLGMLWYSLRDRFR
ncbi:MAG: FAD-binding oxidoreductase [Pseudomonadota bacterium]|nr:FAD-binding oxidoreductase [Pseudomonadota bacterium]